MLKLKWETRFKKTEIGEIPKDWEIKILEKIIIEIKKGIKPKKHQNKNKNLLPYLSAEYLRGETKETNYFPENSGVTVSEKEVIVLWDGSNAGEIFKGMQGILSSTMAKLTPNKDTNPLFLFYQLKNREDEFRDTTTGTGIPHVDKQNLLLKEIIYPPPSEQSRIATVLSWFDDLIENKKRQNEILEKTAMAIFKNWFIDFEPFKNEKFVNSELGKIPKGWEVKAIGEIFDLIKGKKCNISQEYINTYNLYLLIDTYKTGTITYWTESKEPLVEEWDVVLVADGESSGKVLRFQRGILGSTLLVLKPKDIACHIDMRDLVYLFLKFNEDEIMEHRTGSAIPHLDKDFLKDFKFLYPKEHFLEKFNFLVHPLFQKIILNQKQIMLLRKIRDTLLPLLVFGKLRVREI